MAGADVTYSSLSSLDAGTRKARYLALYAALKSERQSGYDAHWRELESYVMPGRTRFNIDERNRGGSRGRSKYIIDSTPRLAARTLQSGLHAGLTSPARPWLKLTTQDPQLAKLKPVAAWLFEVTARMLTLFETSNLYNVLPTVYGDMGTFATAAMSILEDSRDLFRAYAYPVGSYVLGQDERGLVTTFGQEYQLTVRQIVKQFGLQDDGRTIDWSRISGTVKGLWNQGQYEAAVSVLWLVQPNELADRNRLEAKYKPWSSCYMELGAGGNTFLRESGFNEFPFMCPRWDVAGGDTYGGDAPGMLVLGDSKQLQEMQRNKGRAIEKMVNPALTGPSQLMNVKTSLVAGDITYVDVREGQQGLRPIHEVRLDLSHLTADIQDVRYQIKRGYFEDLFLMLAQQEGTQPITAREVEERHEEKLLALGPVLERTNDELLDPIVDRVFAMMFRANLLPPWPQELGGQRVRPTYISILAQAQKLVGVTSQDRLLSTVIPLAEQRPEIWNKLNLNRVVDNYGEMLGTDPNIIRTDEEADALTAQQQQAAAAQQQADQAKSLAGAAKDASQAPLDGNTALSALVGANTGAGAGGAALGGGG